MSQQDMEDLNKISKAVKDYETKMDILGNLPIEILCEVLLYLSPGDLQNVRCCCDLWRNNMESFWKIKCKMENYFECEDDLNSQFYRNFVKGLSHWEGIFMYTSKLRENWINLEFKEVTVMNAEEIVALQHFCGDVIIITNSSGEVLVISCTTGAVENRFSLLAGADMTVIEKIDNRLIVVQTKGMMGNGNPNYLPTVMYLKIWNLENGQILTELEEEIPVKIQKVIIYKDLITLLASPYGVCIFNITKQEVEYEQTYVTSVCHYNDIIALGSHLGKILMMDLDYIELMTLQCCNSTDLSHDRIINEIQMDGNYLVSICLKRSKWEAQACIWNINTKTKLYVVPYVGERGFSIFWGENRLCYKLNKFGFKLCRLDTGKCLLELEFQGILINDFLVIQSDYNNPSLLKMWSIKTGELVTELNVPIFPLRCFDTDYFTPPRSVTKSKIAYFDYDDTQTEEDEFKFLPIQLRNDQFARRPDEVFLKIINFQA